MLFAIRGRTRLAHLTLEEGIHAITRAKRHPVVVAGTADAPGGGAAGDATYLLHALRERGVRDMAMAYLYDPAAVSAAFAAGAGARLRLAAGGKMGMRSGEPLELEFEIVKLFTASESRRAPGGAWEMSRTCAATGPIHDAGHLAIDGLQRSDARRAGKRPQRALAPDLPPQVA